MGNGNQQLHIPGNYLKRYNGNDIYMKWHKITIIFEQDWRKNILGKINSSIVNFLNKAEQKSLTKSDSWSVSDAMAAAVMLQPQLVTKSIVTNVSPVMDGFARGSVLVDYANLTSRSKNTEIIQSIDTAAFQQLVLEKLS